MSTFFRNLQPPLAWRRHLAGAALLLGSLSLSHVADAQVWTWYPSVTPDIRNAQSKGVENTGNEHVPLNGQTLRVMCYDGDNGEVEWSYSPDEHAGSIGHIVLMGSKYGRISDPDIVADPGDYGQRGNAQTDVLVTYMLNGDVCCEVLRYDANTLNMTHVSTAPYVLAKAAENGSNPNVDVDGEGHAAITWSQDGPTGEKYIYVQTYDMPSQTFYPRREVAGEPGFDCTLPDVSIYSSGEKVISVIFIATDGGGQQSVRMTQIGAYALQSNPAFTANYYGAGIEVLPGVTGNFDPPRIAAPPYDQYSVSSNATNGAFEAVVQETKSNKLIGLNWFNNGGFIHPGDQPTVETLNDALAGVVTCRRPVVAYCGDVIEVVWTLVDGDLNGQPVGAVRHGDKEVIRTMLGRNGQPLNGTGINTWYSIVNQQEKLDQSIPSVAGRYADNLPGGLSTGKAYYCFADELDDKVSYKSSNAPNQALRPANVPSTPKPLTTPTAQLAGAYPNPFREAATFVLPLAKDETVQVLEVSDLTGRLVRHQTVMDGTQPVRLDGSDLQAGLYLVRLRTNTGTVHTYRVQHE